MKSTTPEILRVSWIFYRAIDIEGYCFQLDSFGSWRANTGIVRGKESRGSLRGLRAGPASFPRLTLPARNAIPLDCR